MVCNQYYNILSLALAGTITVPFVGTAVHQTWPHSHGGRRLRSAVLLRLRPSLHPPLSPLSPLSPLPLPFSLPLPIKSKSKSQPFPNQVFNPANLSTGPRLALLHSSGHPPPPKPLHTYPSSTFCLPPLLPPCSLRSHSSIQVYTCSPCTKVRKR